MDMKKIHQVAWMGDDYLQGPIRRVVLCLHGLGYNLDKEEPETLELGYAHAGGLVVFPHYGPWCWMNRSARAFVDDLVESVYACYGLGPDVPLVSTGGSMGGLSSLLYARYGRRRPVACLALCPVCDLKYLFGSRPDFPKTIYHAFRDYTEDLETLLEEHSPVYQVPEMPDIPYLVVQGGKDVAVSAERHSDIFVQRMRELGRQVEYILVPYMGHGGPMPVEVLERMIRFASLGG